MIPAINLGIFYDKTTGIINSIMNPDFEEEIDAHILQPNEGVLKVSKASLGISSLMSISQIADIVTIYQPIV